METQFWAKYSSTAHWKIWQPLWFIEINDDSDDIDNEDIDNIEQWTMMTVMMTDPVELIVTLGIEDNGPSVRTTQ